jgi:hypothetical protein
MKRKILSIILTTGLFLFYLKRCSADVFLPKYGKCISSSVTDKTLSRRWHRDELLYEFYVEGYNYTGNSSIDADSLHRDSICVLYLEKYPSINIRYNYFKEIDIDVNCSCNCP